LGVQEIKRREQAFFFFFFFFFFENAESKLGRDQCVWGLAGSFNVLGWAVLKAGLGLYMNKMGP